MKRLFLLLIPFFLSAKVHYAKLEPIESTLIKAEVAGKVVFVKNKAEASLADGLILKIDDSLDKIDLKNTKSSIRLLQESLAINKALLPTLQKNYQKKLALYKKLVNVEASSQNQKDTLFSSVVSAKVQLDSSKEKIVNLQSQILSLKQKVAHLQDSIKKKNIKVKSRYIYKIYPKKGEFVTVATPLLRVDDISRAKLTLYLSEDELKDIDKKHIYIDGKKTDLKFNKIWKVADEEYISSYKAEIVLKPIARFSKLIKVEIK